MPNSMYVAPSASERAFNCPHCGAFAKQFWHSAIANHWNDDVTPLQALGGFPSRKSPSVGQHETSVKGTASIHNLFFSLCYNCKGIGIWICDHLIWPHSGEAPDPNPDIPADVRCDYEEASTILNLSPRGSAALLRLAIQKLCQHLGETGADLNKDIAALVKKGLPVQVQQALDVVRVIGNHAVHPGQLDLRDDRATASGLFGLVNVIAQSMISQPKQIEEMYAKLPQRALDGIARRDKKSDE